ncbi:MAG: hypothetical protein HXM47_04220 [Pseudoleptotrichia goodfellowii]|nr:hypothetical protein [Pseudoleptotrichia goodfellowii]
MRVLGRFISLSIMLVITFNSAGRVQNPLSASSKTVTPSISREKGETTAEYYSKNEDITKGTTYYNNNPEVKVVGVDVQTKGIEGTVKSLDVISVQDKVDSKNTGYNISYGIGIGDHTVVRDGKGMNANGIYTANVGVGYSRGDVTQRTTNAVGSFTAESGVLNVEGKTRQVGSVIGGNFTLKTKEYEHEDLEDINKSRTIGFNITITPGVTEVYRNGRPTGESKGGAAYGTRINYAENDYVAKVKATIGENVSPIIDGKLSELKNVNRDVDNRIEVIKDKEIRAINADLGTEYWATDYAREKARGDFVKAGNKIDRVAEILNAAIKNDNKDIYLYYKDRIAAEEEIARMEREGIDLSIIDKEQAKKIIERAAGGEVDDVQIISSKDPNIKEIIGAEGIRGRAYYTGKGKVVIVADNVEDYAKAIGVIGKEGRHFYHRGNGMEDTEDYSTFYGRQLEKYYRKHFGDADATFVTEQLKYTKEQLGKDWENDAYELGGKFNVTAWGAKVGIEGSIVVVRNPYTNIVDIYLKGKAGVNGVLTFAAAEAKAYLNYYPGALSLYDTEVANKKLQTDLIDKPLSLALSEVGIQKGSLYAKYYDNPFKSHYFSGVGIEIGYGFQLGSLENVFDKIKGLGPKGKEIGKELVKYINSQVGNKVNVGAHGYAKIGSIKSPFLTHYNGNGTKIWLKLWDRPKGK